MDLSPAQNCVPKEYKCTQGEVIQAYIECFRKIYKENKEEIKEVSEIMQSIIAEEIAFFDNKLPQIKKQLEGNDLIDKETKEAWIKELYNNINASFKLSKDIIKDFIAKETEELSKELKADLESARLYGQVSDR